MGLEGGEKSVTKTGSVSQPTFPKMPTVQEMNQHTAEHMICHFNNINRQAGERSRREGMFLCIDKVNNLSMCPMYFTFLNEERLAFLVTAARTSNKIHILCTGPAGTHLKSAALRENKHRHSKCIAFPPLEDIVTRYY